MKAGLQFAKECAELDLVEIQRQHENLRYLAQNYSTLETLLLQYPEEAIRAMLVDYFSLKYNCETVIEKVKSAMLAFQKHRTAIRNKKG